MSTAPLVPNATSGGRVLVVDDDKRVREVLEAALMAHGFEVITAADGDEALHRAQRERPDLVLLDIRLPKRSGLEVCEMLRSDPTDPSVPIILISATPEADQRLQGFLRGADDVLPKPFSPKELVARIRRLLARASETRIAQRRSRELERELLSARREAQRAGEDARREQDRRELGDGAGRDLVRLLDLETFASRLLEIAQLRLRAAAVAMLVTDAAEKRLRPLAVRGAAFDRLAELSLSGHGELAALLEGLARPLRISDLARLPEARAELMPLIGGRWSTIAPLVWREGLDAVLLIEERMVEPMPANALDGLTALLGTAAVALRNALEVRAHAAAALQTIEAPDEVAAEARGLIDRCGRTAGLSPFERERLEHAARLGALDAPRRATLATLAASDPSGLTAGVVTLLDAATGERSERSRAGALLHAILEYRRSRAEGLAAGDALARAAASVVAAEPELAARLEGEAASLDAESSDAA